MLRIHRGACDIVRSTLTFDGHAEIRTLKFPASKWNNDLSALFLGIPNPAFEVARDLPQDALRKMQCPEVSQNNFVSAEAAPVLDMTPTVLVTPPVFRERDEEKALRLRKELHAAFESSQVGRLKLTELSLSELLSLKDLSNAFPVEDIIPYFEDEYVYRTWQGHPIYTVLFKAISAIDRDPGIKRAIEDVLHKGKARQTAYAAKTIRLSMVLNYKVKNPDHLAFYKLYDFFILHDRCIVLPENDVSDHLASVPTKALRADIYDRNTLSSHIIKVNYPWDYDSPVYLHKISEYEELQLDAFIAWLDARKGERLCVDMIGHINMAYLNLLRTKVPRRLQDCITVAVYNRSDLDHPLVSTNLADLNPDQFMERYALVNRHVLRTGSNPALLHPFRQMLTAGADLLRNDRAKPMYQDQDLAGILDLTANFIQNYFTDELKPLFAPRIKRLQMQWTRTRTAPSPAKTEKDNLALQSFLAAFNNFVFSPCYGHLASALERMDVAIVELEKD